VPGVSEQLGVDEVIDLLGLQPMATEAIHYHRFFESAHRLADGHARCTAIVALVTDSPESFSDMHRLPTDEIWQFNLGDAIELLMLHDDGRDELVRLGPDLRAGDRLQAVVPAGSWMGARLAAGGRWGLFSCTMAPGYLITDFEGAEPDALIARWPQRSAEIEAMSRRGVPRTYRN
jgi:predicted cupin superfamily sugar epimerase